MVNQGLCLLARNATTFRHPVYIDLPLHNRVVNLESFLLLPHPLARFSPLTVRIVVVFFSNSDRFIQRFTRVAVLLIGSGLVLSIQSLLFPNWVDLRLEGSSLFFFFAFSFLSTSLLPSFLSFFPFTSFNSFFTSFVLSFLVPLPFIPPLFYQLHSLFFFLHPSAPPVVHSFAALRQALVIADPSLLQSFLPF